mgnify:CR=1 FL=1
MKKFKVYVNVHHVIDDVEANSEQEAKEIVRDTDYYIWDDHFTDLIIKVEEEEDE